MKFSDRKRAIRSDIAEAKRSGDFVKVIRLQDSLKAVISAERAEKARLAELRKYERK